MTERTGPMAPADRAYMRQQTGAGAPWWGSKTDAEKLRVLVGWTMVFTGIVAASVVTSAILGLVAAVAANTPSY